MTDEERVRAIQDFVNFIDAEGWAIRRRPLGWDPTTDEASDQEVSRLLNDHLTRRVRS